MSKTYVPQALRQRVAEHARHRCGYCLTSQRVSGMLLTIEHLLLEARGGKTEEDNLWLACVDCNDYKGDRIEAIDPVSGEVVKLFDPRHQQWSEHFAWNESGDEIAGRTAVGRATVIALRLNRPFLVQARQVWVKAGGTPSQGLAPFLPIMLDSRESRLVYFEQPSMCEGCLHFTGKGQKAPDP